MADANQIADLVSTALKGPEGPEDAGFHTGVIKSWAKDTGINVVTVNGVDLANLKSLQGGIPNYYTAGDVVVIMRKQTQFFILGRVASPGGAAGSGPVSNGSAFNAIFNTSNVWADNPGSPNTPQLTAYIGSTRSALVIFKCEIYVKAGDPGFGADVHNPLSEGGISFQVVGPGGTITAGTYASQAAYNRIEFWNPGAGQAVQSLITAHGEFQIGPGSGIQAGLNTFTMKYKTQGGTAQFINPDMTVIPL